MIKVFAKLMASKGNYGPFTLKYHSKKKTINCLVNKYKALPDMVPPNFQVPGEMEDARNQ